MTNLETGTSRVELIFAKIDGGDGKTKIPDTVAIVGLGYVGLPLAIAAARQGFKTFGYDKDQSKILKIRSGHVNWIKKEEQTELGSLKNLQSSDNSDGLKDADIIVVCVPTPVSKNRLPDLSPLLGAAKTIGENLKSGALVIIESTVNPGVCEEKVLPIIEKESGLVAERDFFFAHCPERVNPGDELYPLAQIPRVVGGKGKTSLKKATDFYSSILKAGISQTNSIKEAEAVKMVENSFRDVNIAFANELAMAFDRAGIDFINVIKAASTKPFGFMPHFPGCGVGGHCIPVDPHYLINYGKKNGFNHRFLKTARAINDNMPSYTISILKKLLRKEGKKIKGSTVAILGLSYKKNIPDLRESPAEKIKELLEEAGAKVKTFDPLLPEHSTEKTLEDVLRDADGAILATDHSEFSKIEPEKFISAGVKIVVDGRNCLDREKFIGAGIFYKGIGRP